MSIRIREAIMPLCSALVRPQLEACLQSFIKVLEPCPEKSNEAGEGYGGHVVKRAAEGTGVV